MQRNRLYQNDQNETPESPQEPDEAAYDNQRERAVLLGASQPLWVGTRGESGYWCRDLMGRRGPGSLTTRPVTRTRIFHKKNVFAEIKLPQMVPRDLSYLAESLCTPIFSALWTSKTEDILFSGANGTCKKPGWPPWAAVPDSEPTAWWMPENKTT